MGFAVEYMTDLYREETIERLSNHYATLLESIVQDLHVTIRDLSPLPAEEKNKLLIEWNNTNVQYDSSPFVHTLFEEQALKYPDRIALVYEDEHLSYASLNQRANQLAHYPPMSG